MINKSQIDKLIEKVGKHCISIYMPTFRAGRTQEDQLRFKNALSEVLDKLQQRGFDKKEAHRFLGKGYELLDNDEFWMYQSDGLAVFISENSFEYYTLPVHFNSRMEIGTTFYIRPLMPMFDENGRFFLLALSQNEVKFFEGNRYSITPVIIDDLVPQNMEIALALDEPQGTLQMHGTGNTNGNPIFHGQGLGKDHKVKQLKQYFTQIDAGLMTMLHDENAPMILATVDSNAPLYRDSSNYTNIAGTHISGNPENTDPVLLHEKAWAIMSDFANTNRKEFKQGFNDLLAANKASTFLSDIVPATVQGKVETIFLDRNAVAWGNYNSEKFAVETHELKQTESYDLLEFAARQVFKQGGTVFNVSKEEFPADEAIVNAIYRF